MNSTSTDTLSHHTPRPFPPHPFAAVQDRDIAPGKYQAKCIKREILCNALIPKWESEAMEKVDLVAFLFRITLPNGDHKLIASKLMKVSFYEKSNLYGFLWQWRGEPPSDLLDIDACVGEDAELTIDRVPGRWNPEKHFLNIVNVAPSPETHRVQGQPT
jgi:hypothetical protein